MWAQSLASFSGLRIWHSHKLWQRSQMWLLSDIAMACGIGLSCSSDLTPSLGTSICHRCEHLKKKGIHYTSALQLSIHHNALNSQENKIIIKIKNRAHYHRKISSKEGKNQEFLLWRKGNSNYEPWSCRFDPGLAQWVKDLALLWAVV